MVSFCDFLRNHVGEFANQVQRAAGMKEGCPIAPVWSVEAAKILIYN